MILKQKFKTCLRFGVSKKNLTPLKMLPDTILQKTLNKFNSKTELRISQDIYFNCCVNFKSKNKVFGYKKFDNQFEKCILYLSFFIILYLFFILD